VESRRLRGRKFQGLSVSVLALIAALALTVMPAQASAASAQLEYVSPGNSFPIAFDAEGGNVSARLGEFDRIVNCADSAGEGEITGPRTTLSSYVFTGCEAEELGGGGTNLKCQSPGAAEKEIRSAAIEAEPVYLNQAKHEVAMLLNPDGGVYMEFECGTNVIKASGPFLAPVDPVNKLATSFTAVLDRDGNSQVPDEYEDLNGVKHQAIPTAVVNAEPPDTSGVGLEFTITPTVPLEIKSVNTVEVEAKQRQEEEAAAKKRQEEEAAAKKRQEEEAARAAAEKQRQEADAARVAAEKQRQEADAARVAGEKKLQEEALQAKEEQLKRQKLRAKGLTRCREADSKRQRVRCETRVKKKFSAPKGATQ
jgi:hypothetical protein